MSEQTAIEEIREKLAEEVGYSLVPKGYSDTGKRKYGCGTDYAIEFTVKALQAKHKKELKEAVIEAYINCEKDKRKRLIASTRLGLEAWNDKDQEYYELLALDFYKANHETK